MEFPTMPYRYKGKLVISHFHTTEWGAHLTLTSFTLALLFLTLQYVCMHTRALKRKLMSKMSVKIYSVAVLWWTDAYSYVLTDRQTDGRTDRTDRTGRQTFCFVSTQRWYVWKGFWPYCLRIVYSRYWCFHCTCHFIMEQYRFSK